MAEPRDHPRIARKYCAALQGQVRDARVEIAARSPAAFAALYLEPLFSKPSSRMHDEVFGTLGVLHERRGSHLAIAAPRGHAKSTIVSLAYVLWCMIFQREPFILLVSASADQAAKLLDHVKRQCESNLKLRLDFPELEGVKSITPWRKNSILLPNGSLLMCYCAGQNLRGARHGKNRPTLIVCDDLEDKLEVDSEDQRLKLADWFHSTLLKAGTPETNVAVVGNVLHHSSLLATLLSPTLKPGWERLRNDAIEQTGYHPELWERWAEIFRGREEFRGGSGPEAAKAFYEEHQGLLEEGGRVQWPQMYSMAALMAIRLREGETSFQAEYQNEPLDSQRCMFAGAPIRYWDDDYKSVDALLAAVGTDGDYYGACDPGLGGDLTRGDYSAIVIVYVPRDSKTKYVVAADRSRRTPHATVARILELARIYPFREFAVEANNFQRLMVDDLEGRAREAGLRIYVNPVQNSKGKLQRIASLDVEISQGLLVFNRAHRLLLDQLRGFPLAQYDDGPDALEMAVREASDGGLSAAFARMPRGRIIFGD